MYVHLFSYSGHPTLLSQPTQVLQLQSPQVVPTGSRVLTMPNLAQDRLTNPATPAATPPVVGISLVNPASDEDVSL